mmetsp:Transcript_22915/g.73337  ORF Transcript_22915/g.73337 Transcript_22915/m.73337 type:complete len:104 (-) Transcript_22915:529-840(-)
MQSEGTPSQLALPALPPFCSWLGVGGRDCTLPPTAAAATSNAQLAAAAERRFQPCRQQPRWSAMPRVGELACDAWTFERGDAVTVLALFGPGKLSVISTINHY